jgi:helicase
LSAPDELRRADAVAAALNRGLRVDPISWEQLLAIAQQELGRYQQRRTLDRAFELYDEEAASGLIAAARIIQEIASRNAEEVNEDALEFSDGEEESDSDAIERRLLLILSSCAFGMYGNFPSAAAVQRLLDLAALQTEGQWLAIAISNPSQIQTALRSDCVTPTGREFLERLNFFLVTGDEATSERLIENFEELMRVTRPPADIVFLRCVRLALKHIITLAVSNLYRLKLGKLLAGFLERIILKGRPCLLPPQYTLINDQGILGETANTVVTIPTSTGKTLLGELAIAARLEGNGDIAVFVAPYVALGRQVYECFMQHAPPSVEIRGYFGNFNSHIAPLSPLASTIIIATPERLDAILRTQDLYARLRTVVFDEAHGIENGVRGARLEALITRLRLQQARHTNIRLILLSAVLSDVESVRLWLGIDAVHCRETWRPTARRLGVWMDNGELGWLWGTDPLRPSDRRATQFIGLKKLTWPEYVRPAGSYPGIQAQKPAAFRNAAFLARYLHDSIGGPVLLACASKAGTRGLAAAIASALPEKQQPSRARDDLIERIKTNYSHLAPLAAMAAKGVAYHNASLPSSVRIGIEDALKVRALDFVAATTTLAEGIDLPFRVTVLFDWLTGFRDQQAPMASLLFRNIAGRCGRAGEFTEGDTIIFDNVLGNLAYTGDEQRRRRAQAGLFGDPPPLQSVIANDHLPDEIKSAVRAVVSSQFLASIPENPAEDVLEETWARSTYAAFRSSNPTAMLREVRAELLTVDQGEPFARAASPMLLTSLGAAANRSGFGPRTCRQILRRLSDLDVTASAEELASDLLIALGACDEQSNYLLRDIALKKRTKFFVKAEDLASIATGWLDGRELTEIFLSLPRAIKSKAVVTPLQWAQGKVDYEPVAAQYDKFVDVTEYAFGGFLPWLLRAISALAPFSSPAVVAFDWDELASRFEKSRLADAAIIDEMAASAFWNE